ncbi:MAG: halocarboxylic acid dehydrogenase DehI family protein [Myxococcota bacterium]
MMLETLTRGADAIRAVGEVMVADASPDVVVLYQDIQRSLRVPFVNFIFRALANRPDYLRDAWQTMAPGVRTQAFEALTDELRERALAAVASWPGEEEMVWPAGEDGETLRRFTETIRYVLPQLVTVITALHTDRIAPRPETLRSGARSETPLEGSLGLPMRAAQGAPGAVITLYEDIKDHHGHPGVASYYRALGFWPEALQRAWGIVRPHVNTPGFVDARKALLQVADVGVAQRFVVPQPAIAPESQIRDLLGFFRYRLAIDLLLDVSLLTVRTR